MTRVALRLPADLVRALEDHAEKRGLKLGPFIRTQLLAAVHKPANILRPIGEITR